MVDREPSKLWLISGTWERLPIGWSRKGRSRKSALKIYVKIRVLWPAVAGCFVSDADNRGLTIPSRSPSGPGVTSSTITVSGGVIIADVDVTVNIQHFDVGALEIYLTAPDSTEIFLAGADNGGPNFIQTVFDQVWNLILPFFTSVKPGDQLAQLPQNPRPTPFLHLCAVYIGGPWPHDMTLSHINIATKQLLVPFRVRRLISTKKVHRTLEAINPLTAWIIWMEGTALGLGNWQSTIGHLLTLEHWKIGNFASAED